MKTGAGRKQYTVNEAAVEVVGEQNADCVPLCHYCVPLCHYCVPLCHYCVPLCHYCVPLCRLQERDKESESLKQQLEAAKSVISKRRQQVEQLKLMHLELAGQCEKVAATSASACVRYGMVWHGVVWYGMLWYGMAWYGMVW